MKAVEQHGRRACLVQADLTSVAACARLVRDTTAALGPIDILVNNAAIFEGAALDAMQVDDLDRHYQSNTRPIYALSLDVGRSMVKRHEADANFQGVIINIACVAAMRPWGAIRRIQRKQGRRRQLDRRLRAPDSRPLCASTPSPPARSSHPAMVTPRRAKASIDATLLKRYGKPHDIAQAACLLARASYMTGVVLAVDGGRSIA